MIPFEDVEDVDPWKRAKSTLLHLFAETLRESGILVGVFGMLEEKPFLFWILLVSSFCILLGIAAEIVRTTT